jgi:glycyl-tRNA synthetase
LSAQHLDYIEKQLNDKAVTEEVKEELRKLEARIDDLGQSGLRDVIRKYDIKSYTNNPVSDPQPFNLMFETQIGPTGQFKGYLRPETAQGIFVNFARLLEQNGGKLPFAGATIGTAFRNEIAPRSGLLRVREFTLAEIEHFVSPHNKIHPKFARVENVVIPLYSRESQLDDQKVVPMTIGEAVKKGIVDNETLGYFIARVLLFLHSIGVKKEYLRFRQHLAKEMAHYARDCWDAEIFTSYGWVESVGIADRSAFDLTAHSEGSKARLSYYEQFPEAQLIKVLEVKPNAKVIGTTYKKQGKEVSTYLESLNTDSVAAEELECALKNGKKSISVGDNTYEISSDMVFFNRVEKKISGRNIIPSVIEPSFGIGRIIYGVLEHNYHVRDGDEQRGYLSLPPVIAPYKCSVLPLVSNSQLAPYIPRLEELLVNASVACKVDDTGHAIGRRYARTDEIGIPFGITVDFQTVQDDTVTLRERDTTKQVRVKVDEVAEIISRISNLQLSWDDVLAKYPIFTSTAE